MDGGRVRFALPPNRQHTRTVNPAGRPVRHRTGPLVTERDGRTVTKRYLGDVDVFAARRPNEGVRTVLG